MEITFTDLFCGAGGLSLGLQKAGMVPIAAYDLCESSVRTYNANVANVAHVKDVTTITPNRILQKTLHRKNACNVIVGGPPCQGFSKQNHKYSPEDKRNFLVDSLLKLTRSTLPELFMIENVSTVGGVRGKNYMGAIHKYLSKKYHIQEEMLNAAQFGVPQIRKRMFVVGVRKDIYKKLGPFAFPTPVFVDKQKYKTVKNALQDLPLPGRRSIVTGEIVENHIPGNMSALNYKRFSYVPQGGGWEDIPKRIRYKSQQVRDSKVNWTDTFGRLSWKLPAPTITAGCHSLTKGRFGHPKSNRTITPREAARIQSFPDDFVFIGGRLVVCKQIGNAVPPLLGKQLGNSIVKYLHGLTP